MGRQDTRPAAGILKRAGPGTHYQGMGPVLVRTPAALDPLQGALDRYLLTGDEEALELVVRETRPRLVAAARRIGASQDAEDAVQSAYLSLVRHRGGRLDAPVFPWLLTAVIRIAYRRKAMQRREEGIARALAVPKDGPAPDAGAMDSEEAERLRREVDRLPEKYRDPVALHYLHGLPTPEVARLLDLPEATVRTRLLRARRILRSRLPAGWALALFAVPWLLRDAGHGAGGALGLATAGGVMTTGGTVGIVVAAVAVGAVLGAKLLGGGAPAEDPAKATAAVEAKAAADRQALENRHGETLAALRKDLAEAKSRAEKSEQDLAASREEIAGLRSAAEAVRTAAAPAATPKDARADGPRFSFGEYDAALREVDWKAVGSATKALAPLIVELRDASRKGGPLPIEAIAKTQQQNTHLVSAALKIHEKLPGSGINGAFTHPAFMVNSMASTLEAAGLPLSDAQAEALGKLGREFTDRDRARASGYDDRTLALQKILDEAEMKDRFFEQAFALMTPDQAEALHPTATRGLTSADLYSSGLMLAQRAGPVRAKDRDDFVARLEPMLAERLGVPADRRADFGEAVRQWGADLPEEIFAQDTELLLGQQPLFRVALVEDMMRREIVLLRRIADEMGMPEEVSKAARGFEAALVPLVKKG